MSWLFGSKKSKPEVYISNEVEGDFNVITTVRPQEQGRAQLPYPTHSHGNAPSGQYPYPAGGGMAYPPSRADNPHVYPSLPPQGYPQVPYLAICPQAPPDYKPRSLHPLDSIPFKLSSSLDTSSSRTKKILDDLESIRNAFDRLAEKMKSSEYNYSFELERNVLREERSYGVVN